MTAPNEAQRAADRLADDLAPLGVETQPVVAARHAFLDWAASGAMALTGAQDGPALLAPGAPASAFRGALAFIDGHMPGIELLGERAAIAGFTRRAPWSPGGAFQILPARNGWLGISLARRSDFDTLPALIEGAASHKPWDSVARWLGTKDVDEAAARAHLLGLAATVIGQPTRARRPVEITLGGRREPIARPMVLDLTSLWAGPLCAHLLGLSGARVIKVESVARPDGARSGPRAFYDLLHGGHESVALDFRSQRHSLARLVEHADVVLESSRPRALQQIGIDARSFVAAGGIWLSITSYGRQEPMRIGFGDDVAAGAGLFTWLDGRPIPVGDALADPLTGAYAAAAATTALGASRGCLLDVSMHDVAAAAAAVQVESAQCPTPTAPTARPVSVTAHRLGADTRTVLAEFGGDRQGRLKRR